MKIGYLTGVSESYIDHYEIDHGVALTWNVIRDTLQSKQSPLTPEEALTVLDEIFDQEDAHWENAIQQGLGNPEFRGGEDLPFWDEIIIAAEFSSIQIGINTTRDYNFVLSDRPKEE